MGDLRRHVGCFGLSLLFPFLAAAAPPFVYYRGIVNVASYLPPGLPNGAIARGSMFAIFGKDLGPAVAAQVSSYPLSATFAGVSIQISQIGSQGTATANALPAFVSATQINAILPSNAPVGWVTLRVTYNGQQGNPSRMFVVENSIGLFSANGGGFGPASVQNFVSAADQPINSLTKTARPGQVMTLWGTGLGPASFSDAVAPTAVSLEIPVEVLVAGRKARILYSGRTPCCAGIDQFVFEVPADVPSGCYVPVVVRTRGTTVSNTVTMAIDPAGAACRDTHNPLSEQFRRGGTVALAQLLREEMRVDLRVLQPYDVTHDALAATFRTESPSDYYFNAVTAMPPVGTCTVYSGAASRVFSDASQFAPRGSQINVGSPITVASGATRATAASSPGFEGTFLSVLGGQRPFDTLLPPPLLTGGPFSFSSLTFTTVLDNVNPLSWTNRDQVTRVRRAEDLELRWSGDPGASRGVAILGLSEQSSGNASSGFACLAPRGATTFVVPAYVLAALPASDEAEPYASARISIGNIPLTAGPALSGFDYAFLGVSKWISKTVVIE